MKLDKQNLYINIKYHYTNFANEIQHTDNTTTVYKKTKNKKTNIGFVIPTLLMKYNQQTTQQQ